MRIPNLVASLFLLQLSVGCTENFGELDKVRGFSHAEKNFRVEQKSNSQYLAYIHRLSIDLPAAEIAGAHKKVVESCLADKQFQCTILHTELSDGRYKSGSVNVRILPDGVDFIIGIAKSSGDISRQSTDVEDLTDAIVDNKKRLEMLTDYRDRLLVLDKQSVDDIESLVKIASELSTVQSDLEYATGEKAKLLQRVGMDIVNLRFESERNRSFSESISNALIDFSDNLSEGIATTITFIAFLLPMLLILVPVAFLLKWVWQKNRKDPS